MAKQSKNFATEAAQVLELMVHSVYSQREIFLRELVSNGSDALDKLRYAEIKDPSLAPAEEKHLRITVNKAENTLSISDNGIGMTEDEVVRNIGTIAYSGTKDFIGKLKELKDKPELIGQFGVGFYSAFMVADKVTLHSQKAGTRTGVVFESEGTGTYTIDEQQRVEGCGTTVTLHLKKFGEEEEEQDFLDEWTIRSIIRKYSDFIEYPIKMKVERTEPVLDKDGKAIEGKTETKTVDETLNSQKALWLRPTSEISKEEYNEFYKHVAKDWTEPLEKIHYRAEGTQEFAALMYIPQNVPFDYYQREAKFGFSLYVKRVFIMDCCEELIPRHFRFMKGVVDSSDLPLNVSREILQKDRRLVAIRKALVSKLLRQFKSMIDKDREAYEKFWKNFGATLKEGIPTDSANKEALTELTLFQSTHSEGWTTLKEYTQRMASGQEKIFFITGESKAQIQNSPYLEKLRKKNFEVLLLTDPVDEWVMNSLTEFDGKQVVPVTREGLEIDSEAEQEKAKENRAAKAKDLEPVLSSLKTSLSDKIQDVKISDRLVNSPACLVSSSEGPSAHMERMMESLGQSMPKSKRILEINADHPVVKKMIDLTDDTKKTWAEVLYNQALLNEGSQLDNPSQFCQQIADLMLASQTQ